MKTRYILMTLLSSTSLLFGNTWKIKNSSTEDIIVTLTRQNTPQLSLQIPSGQEITQDVGTSCVSKIGVKGVQKKLSASTSLKQVSLSTILSQELIESSVPGNGCKDHAIEIDNKKETATIPEHMQEEYGPGGNILESRVVPVHTEERITLTPKPSLVIKFLS